MQPETESPQPNRGTPQPFVPVLSPFALLLLAVSMMSLLTGMGVELARLFINAFYGLNVASGELPGTATPVAVEATKVLNAITQVVGFGVPALLFAFLVGSVPGRFSLPLGYPGWRGLALTVVLAVLAIAPVEALVLTPETFELPAPFQEFERWAETQETRSERDLIRLLAVNLPLNLFVLALIPAAMEELFFRGVVLRLLLKITPVHVAVWVGAALFSLLHFQFLGFVPRMLLGGFFGYLVVYSGSLWPAILAHFTHNGINVLMAYAALNGVPGFEGFLTKHAFPFWVAPLCAVLFTMLAVWASRRTSLWTQPELRA